MGLLRREYLAEEILPNRFGKEFPVRAREYGDKPGQDQNREPRYANKGPEQEQPLRGAIHDSKRQCGKPDHHDDQRPLEKHPGSQCGPEHGRHGPTVAAILKPLVRRS